MSLGRLVNGFEVKAKQLQEALESNSELRRKVGREAYWGGLLGGLVLFLGVAGPKLQVTWWKPFFFFYSLNPVMKVSGCALVYAMN